MSVWLSAFTEDGKAAHLRGRYTAYACGGRKKRGTTWPPDGTPICAACIEAKEQSLAAAVSELAECRAHNERLRPEEGR